MNPVKTIHQNFSMFQLKFLYQLFHIYKSPLYTNEQDQHYQSRLFHSQLGCIFLLLHIYKPPLYNIHDNLDNIDDNQLHVFFASSKDRNVFFCSHFFIYLS